MKAASSKEIKTALQACDLKQCQDLILRLARFKKDNKELLTYLLFDSESEENYIRSVCQTIIADGFENLNRKNYYWMRKGIRKILRDAKRFIRYSGKKETEIEILIYFLIALKSNRPSYQGHRALLSIYQRQKELVSRQIEKVHPDLRFDYTEMLMDL